MIHLSNLHMTDIEHMNWAVYFEENHAQRLQIDFSEEPQLSPEEKELIFPSIREFQKGEASDGRFLLKCARRFAKKNNVPEYPAAMEWFIREENWHSFYLKQYMDYHRVTVRDNSVLDTVFRLLRKIGGLRSEVIVLVTAEMIALPYYSALAKCTGSAALKSICTQMLADELRHIVFQSCTLYKMKTNPFERLLRILFMEITMTVVWCSMKKVFLAGGYSFRRFASECLGYLGQSIEIEKRGRL
ncbi:MAG: hypothetical protein NC434_13355 [Ruminococcus sp.]|nr:hypothetical protein [Ruminococcus sp.]